MILRRNRHEKSASARSLSNEGGVTYQNGKPKKIDYFSHYLMWNEVNSITLCFDEHGIPVQYYHGDEKDRLYDVTKVNRKYYAQQYGMNGL